MKILFLGKRHYTNHDVLLDRFGRIYWLPKLWHRAGTTVQFFALDYYSQRRFESVDDGFEMTSLPAFSIRSMAELKSSMERMKADIVLASGDCFIGLLAYRLARSSGAKFVFDVYDDYSTFGAYRLFFGWNALEFLCREADLVVYASKLMCRSHDFANPSALIPNGIDPEHFRPMSMVNARRKLGLPPAARLVGYFGSMKKEHGIHVLVQAVRLLRTKESDLQLLLCGKQDAATPVSGEGIIFRGFVPHAEIPTYLNASDILALPYLRSAFMDSASSCKIAEYLACQRPIVATNSPNFVENFPEQAKQLGEVLVPPGDASALARAIGHQLNDPIVAQPPTKITWDELSTALLGRLRQLSD